MGMRTPPVFLGLLLWVVSVSGAQALLWTISLYEPGKLAERGIALELRETKSGVIACEISLPKEGLAKGVSSVTLSSQTPEASMETSLMLLDWEGRLRCRFELSRNLLLHGNVRIGLIDDVPGGTELCFALVDMVVFGEALPEKLALRQKRLEAMGLIKTRKQREDEFQRRLEELSNDRRKQGESEDFAKLLKQLDGVVGKVEIQPFVPEGKQGR